MAEAKRACIYTYIDIYIYTNINPVLIVRVMSAHLFESNAIVCDNSSICISTYAYISFDEVHAFFRILRLSFVRIILVVTCQTVF